MEAARAPPSGRHRRAGARRAAPRRERSLTLASSLYIDTSAVLRAVLETGTTPEIEQRLHAARALITSRLSQVEAARALLRLRHLTAVSEEALADAAREIDALWARCELWELTPAVCELAGQVAPHQPLRTLDAFHLATYLLARRRVGDIELLTADQRLADAARSA
ncbi:MAG: type II toxin-antitoxin system VapC family toxin [Gemmatimonadaceae bacterium]